MKINDNKRTKFDHRDPFAARDWDLKLGSAKYGSVTEDLKDLFSRRKQLVMPCFKNCPTCERPFQSYMHPDVTLDKPMTQYSRGDTKVAAEVRVKNEKSVEDDILKEINAGLEPSREYNIYTNQAIEGDDIPTSKFSTDKVFRSHQDLIDWVRHLGRSLGYIIVIKRSKTKPNGVMSKVVLTCNRGGKYKYQGNSIRNGGSIKTNCPFQLIGKYSFMHKCWTLRVRCAEHNHEPLPHMEGQPFAMRLTEKEVCLVEDLLRKNVKPRDILSTLKQQNPDNLSSLKTIYNTCQKIWAAEREGRNRNIQEAQPVVHGPSNIDIQSFFPGAPSTYPKSVSAISPGPLTMQPMIVFETPGKCDIRNPFVSKRFEIFSPFDRPLH